jgi:nicotinamide mononucleotide adenylyltransferase
MERTKVGIFVGRMCPIHVGHQHTIDTMIEEVGEANSLIILGSVGQKVTFRVLFSYRQRRQWIRNIYGPNMRVVGVPDFPGDNGSWLQLVTDQINSAFAHYDNPEIVFYGGSLTDVEIFTDRGYAARIVDRSVMPVSATVIRDMALRGMDIAPFVHEDIREDFIRKFAQVMEESESWETPTVKNQP